MAIEKSYYTNGEAPPMEEELVIEVENPDSVTVSTCLLYTSPSPRDRTRSRMPSSA